jgi:hypothetical protein
VKLDDTAMQQLYALFSRVGCRCTSRHERRRARAAPRIAIAARWSCTASLRRSSTRASAGERRDRRVTRRTGGVGHGIRSAGRTPARSPLLLSIRKLGTTQLRSK